MAFRLLCYSITCGLMVQLIGTLEKLRTDVKLDSIFKPGTETLGFRSYVANFLNNRFASRVETNIFAKKGFLSNSTCPENNSDKFGIIGTIARIIEAAHVINIMNQTSLRGGR